MQIMNTQPVLIRIIRYYTIKRLHFTEDTNMKEQIYTACIKIHVIADNLLYKNCLKTNV